MADRIGTKTHLGRNSLNYNCPFEKDLAVNTLNASQSNGVSAAAFVLTLACKIPLVAVLTSSAASGITAFNIAIGTAAEAGVLVPSNADVQYPPTVNTTPGLCLFMAGTPGNFTGPQDYTTLPTTAQGALIAYPSEPDAIFPQGTVLTLRYTSGATVAGNIKVSCLCIPVDLYPSYPNFWTWGNANVG